MIVHCIPISSPDKSTKAQKILYSTHVYIIHVCKLREHDYALTYKKTQPRQATCRKKILSFSLKDVQITGGYLLSVRTNVLLILRDGPHSNGFKAERMHAEIVYLPYDGDVPIANCIELFSLALFSIQSM